MSRGKLYIFKYTVTVHIVNKPTDRIKWVGKVMRPAVSASSRRHNTLRQWRFSPGKLDSTGVCGILIGKWSCVFAGSELDKFPQRQGGVNIK